MHPLLPTLLRLLCTGSLMLLSQAEFCQPVIVGPDQPIDAQTRTAVIHQLSQQLNAQYIFPKVSAQIEQVLQTRLVDGVYARITSSKAFADTITAELQRVSHDKHLHLFYQHQPVSSVSSDPTQPSETHKLEHHGRHINWGFGKPERLAGNVGYLRIDEFMPVELAAETATAAMTYLSQTDALILDLRHNRGGEPAMVAFLASYFFGPDSVHLNDLVRREGQPVASFWTWRQLPGLRYVGKPLYILTSRKTFSAGEEFAYDLQSLNRAAVVGEPTAGGAHSGDLVGIGTHFVAFIPTEYARNPITGTNWERVGVQPNVKTTENEAMQTAYVKALKTLGWRKNSPGKHDELTTLIEQVIAASSALNGK